MAMSSPIPFFFEDVEKAAISVRISVCADLPRVGRKCGTPAGFSSLEEGGESEKPHPFMSLGKMVLHKCPYFRSLEFKRICHSLICLIGTRFFQ